MRQEVDRALSRTASSPQTSEVDGLVEAIQAGVSPEENFGRLFERYCAPVTHFFANRGFTDQAAEDLAQESFIRVYKSIGGFRFESKFETWLFRIVANVWKNALRRQSTKKRRADELPFEEATAPPDPDRRSHSCEPEDPAASPLESILDRERQRLLAESLDRLSPKMREYMLLRLGQGLKYREIAVIMKVSMSTVKTQLSIGFKRLEPLLREHYEVFEI